MRTRHPASRSRESGAAQYTHNNTQTVPTFSILVLVRLLHMLLLLLLLPLLLELLLLLLVVLLLKLQAAAC